MISTDTDLMDQHIESLGLISVAAYKLWCRRNGFPVTLEKTAEDLEEERACFSVEDGPSDPRVSKDHSPRRAELIQRMAEGEFERSSLNLIVGQPLISILTRIRGLFAEVAGVKAGRESLLRLLLHVEKYADLLHCDRVYPNQGHSQRNMVISGISQLGLHHESWIRPVEDWFPTERRRERQFFELAEHLFVRYEVPESLHYGWFESDPREREIQQSWFLHVAAGGNIRKGQCLPFRLTKRAAHLFATEWYGKRQPPLIALREAQIASELETRAPREEDLPILFRRRRRFSGNIASHECICGRENADFWTTIIHFFLNNPMLEVSYIGPIIDYIHHQKFVSRGVPQPNGTVLEAPPAHPGFCIKGRSINKLVREVDDWHASLTSEDSEKVLEWEPSGISGFELEEYNEELQGRIRWTVEELCTSALLHVEGRVMHHCVWTYARRCVAGRASIFSIRVQPISAHRRRDEEEPERIQVLTMAVDSKRRQITQARGKYNLLPQGKMSKAKRRRTDSHYLMLLKESARIMALWRQKEGLGYAEG